MVSGDALMSLLVEMNEVNYRINDKIVLAYTTEHCESFPFPFFLSEQPVAKTNKVFMCP